jgi:type I restriction enzyme S subunit
MREPKPSRPQPAATDLPEGWASAIIADITVPKVDQCGPGEGDEFTYVDIASVDNNEKRITAPRLVPKRDAPSRARQVVRSGDVLVSMTRPNLNAVALVGPDLNGAIASTGFDVLRSIEVTPGWLFLIVRSQAFIDSMTTFVQGALYPAVRPLDVRSFELPIPPLAEQKRIVAKIEALLEQTKGLTRGWSNCLSSSNASANPSSPLPARES